MRKRRKKSEELQVKVKDLEDTKEKAKELQLKIKELEDVKARADELKDKIETLEEEKRKAEKLQVRINKLEEGKKKADELQARLKALEEEKKTAEALQARVITLEEEKNKAQGLETRIVELEEEKIKAEELRKKIKELEEEKKKTETLQGKIQELQWRETHLFNSSYVLNKLGIREVLWRNGNSQADLINEKMLYEEAKKLNITPDMNEHKGIVEKYKFDGDQADFLYRYMTIFAFINAKLTDLPTEDVIEQLMVQYDEENKYTKIVLASELQAQAKSGISFEEIYNLYPDLVTVDIVKFEDLGKNIQEKVRQIPVGGIGVIWSEEGYRILKPTSRKLSLKPFQELQPAAKEKIKGYINDLILGIEKGSKISCRCARLTTVFSKVFAVNCLFKDIIKVNAQKSNLIIYHYFRIHRLCRRLSILDPIRSS